MGKATRLLQPARDILLPDAGLNGQLYGTYGKALDHLLLEGERIWFADGRTLSINAISCQLQACRDARDKACRICDDWVSIVWANRQRTVFPGKQTLERLRQKSAWTHRPRR